MLSLTPISGTVNACFFAGGRNDGLIKTLALFHHCRQR
jgi:hypothetical protein